MVGVGGVPRGGGGGGGGFRVPTLNLLGGPVFFFLPNSFIVFGGCGIGPFLGGPLRRG